MAIIEDAAEQRKRAQVQEWENAAKERLYRRLVREIATLERAGEHDRAAGVRKQRDQLQPEIDELAAAKQAAIMAAIKEAAEQRERDCWRRAYAK
jgi:hypothetical protein